MTYMTYTCGSCGAPQPGVHYPGCAQLQGYLTPPNMPSPTDERIAAALERIAAALERKP